MKGSRKLAIRVASRGVRAIPNWEIGWVQEKSAHPTKVAQLKLATLAAQTIYQSSLVFGQQLKSSYCSVLGGGGGGFLWQLLKIFQYLVQIFEVSDTYNWYLLIQKWQKTIQIYLTLYMTAKRNLIAAALPTWKLSRLTVRWCQKKILTCCQPEIHQKLTAIFFTLNWEYNMPILID